MKRKVIIQAEEACTPQKIVSSPIICIDSPSNCIKTDETHKQDVLNYIERKYNDQILFDIKTVAKEILCSYEFVRQRIEKGIIKCVSLGTNKMIPKSELIKLLIEGVQ